MLLGNTEVSITIYLYAKMKESRDGSDTKHSLSGRSKLLLTQFPVLPADYLTVASLGTVCWSLIFPQIHPV